MNFLIVGLGGALGVVMRYAISLIPCKGSFPVLTLFTNFAGAFMIGIFTGLAVKKGWPDSAVLFLKTGVCGGFTTFSTFSLETYNLFQAHRPVMAILYMIVSLLICLAGVAIGMYISQRAAGSGAN